MLRRTSDNLPGTKEQVKLEPLGVVEADKDSFSVATAPIEDVLRT
jgi:hypothetical protein